MHFHDPSHETISRFFEIGLTTPEVASIGGHRDAPDVALIVPNEFLAAQMERPKADATLVPSRSTVLVTRSPGCILTTTRMFGCFTVLIIRQDS